MVEWKKLSDVAVIKNGKDYKKLSNGNIPVFGTGGIMTYVDQFASDKPSVLLPRKGSIENIFYVDEPFWTVDTLYWTDIDTSKIDPKFLFVSLQRYNLKEFAYGGARPSLSQQILYNLDIPLPSLSEQKRIVGILDTFTASIDNLKEQIAQRRKQYEYYRDQLLDLEGKDIEEVLSFGNDFQLKARIGWQGLTKKEYKETGAYKLVTGTDFTRNLRIDFDNCVYVDKERYEQDEYIQLKVGDVLITKDGTLGKVAYIDILEIPATLNGGVFVVRDLKNRVLPKFLMFYLTSYHFKKWMQQNHTTGSIQHLTQKLLSSFTIPVFSLEEQQRIVSILDTFEASIQNLEAQLSQREKQYEYYRNKLLTFE